MANQPKHIVEVGAQAMRAQDSHRKNRPLNLQHLKLNLNRFAGGEPATNAAGAEVVDSAAVSRGHIQWTGSWRLELKLLAETRRSAVSACTTVDEDQLLISSGWRRCRKNKAVEAQLVGAQKGQSTKARGLRNGPSQCAS